MSAPRTTLDPRFSDPETDAVSWDVTSQLLDAAQLFWISTVRRDGRPHVTPLVAVWVDDALSFATGPREQKAVNLRHNRRVTLTTGCNDWEQGVDVVVEGVAERVTDQAQLERLAAAWEAKWDGRWTYAVGDGCFRHDRGGEVLVFRVAPERVFAFSKGGFGQTRHAFDDSPPVTASPGGAIDEHGRRSDEPAYTVVPADERSFESPSWASGDDGRAVIELARRANLRHSQANLWRYPPGARGRRHREPVQEEIFCVVEGTLTMLLGEPASRVSLTPRSLVVVEPGTALQLRNESDADVVFFAYGAPHQPSDYKAEILPDA